MNGLIGNQPAQNSNMPRASINWIVLDEQFKWVSGGFDMVATATDGNGTLKYHNNSTIPTITVNKNGYIYVWASNESKFDVFFDNLQLIHTRGPVLEETHYYPFGLTMAGISSKALSFGDQKNKEKTFQGQRFDDELGLNWVQFKWRNHDPQIGRFIEIDPLSTIYTYNSTYAFSENKVTGHVELEGLEAVSMQTYIAARNYYTSRGLDFTGKISNDGMINTVFILPNRIKRVESGTASSLKSGIVLHRTVSSNTKGTLGSFASTGAGTHFLVGKDGAIYQTASLNQGTYHFRPDLQINHFHLNRANTISIEVVGMPIDKDGKPTMDGTKVVGWEALTDEQTRSVALLVNSLITTYELTNQDIYHHEDIQVKAPGEGGFVHDAIRPYLNPANEAMPSQGYPSQGYGGLGQFIFQLFGGASGSDDSSPGNSRKKVAPVFF